MADSPVNETSTATEAAPSSEPAVHGNADVAALQAQVRDLTNSMQAMHNMYSQQLGNMQSALSSRQQPAAQQKPQLPQFLERMDQDDPYYDAFKEVASGTSQENAALRRQVSDLMQQVNHMNMNMSQRSVQEQVDQAIQQHGVPEALAHDVRTTAYAYMTQTPNGQQVSVDALVGNFMKNLKVYSDTYYKERTEEARKPKPISAITSAAGIPQETPRTFGEASEQGLALIKAMMAQ